jgi:hypothetical protein
LGRKWRVEAPIFASGDLNLQEISKMIVVKDEKNEKIGYMRCNIFHDF